MHLTTVPAQHLHLPVQTVSSIYSILIFFTFIYSWDVMLYSLVHRYEHFKWPCHLQFQDSRCPECGSSRFLWNTGTYLPDCTATRPRGQMFIAKDSCKSHIYVWVFWGDAGFESAAKTIGQHKEMDKIHNCTRLWCLGNVYTKEEINMNRCGKPRDDHYIVNVCDDVVVFKHIKGPSEENKQNT